MAQYYVIRDKNTGLYFRGKGVNRWGKHYNQASIYRVKGSAEHTIKEISWRGERAEIVPIQIIETAEDVIPKSEVEKLSHKCDECAGCTQWKCDCANIELEVAREIFEEIDGITDLFAKGLIGEFEIYDKLAELKKKYTESKS